MSYILPAAVSLIFFVLSGLQFSHKGPPLNNAYLYASPKERETMDKKPVYQQSAIVFLLLGLIFLLVAAEYWLRADWPMWLCAGLMALTVIYALASSAKYKHKK